MLRRRAIEHLNRRNLLGVLALAPCWPRVTGAQQPTFPVVGFLSSGSPRAFTKFLKAFQQGLSEAGFVDGRNLAINYRWAEGHFDELDALAAELVADRVTVIAATGGLRSVQAAKKATATIPIVALLGFDPVKLGIVESFNKPGGNITGTTIIANELGPKRLSLLYDLGPGIQKVALLVNPASTNAELEIESVSAAAKNAGRPIVALKAGTTTEIDAAFAAATAQEVQGLILNPDPFFTTRRNQLVALAMTHKIPVVYSFREFVDDGGLMSYGPSLVLAYRVAGIYVGRILNGTKPGDLPIEVPTKFEFVINLKTAMTMGLNIPPGLLAIVDDTVE
jgi:putative tryptophan/tyrosine transport system substrate-binding protein